MRPFFIALFATTLFNISAFAQVTPCNCSANVGSGNKNFSTLTWTGTGCPTAGSTSYTGNLCLNLANGANLIMDKDFAITGGLGISNGGNSTFTLPSGMDLSVTTDMGDDDNNNVTFAIDGNLTVGGGLFGKNSNAFDGSGAGSGSITAGSLVFSGTPTCISPANCAGFTWNIGTCAPAGSAFCNNVNSVNINPQPVTLLYFSTKVNGSAVDITWATATEINSSYFVVERSFDGKSFYEIAREDAAGNSIQRKEYSTSDEHPLIGRTYYRLKEVDLDGTAGYFSMRFVQLNGKRSVAVYPNPIVDSEDITVALNFSSDAKVIGKLMDPSGREIKRFTFSGSETTLPFKPEKGIYILSLTSGSETYMTRFIVP